MINAEAWGCWDDISHPSVIKLNHRTRAECGCNWGVMRTSYTHNSIRRPHKPKEAPYERPGVEDEAKDRSEGEQVFVDGLFGVKLLCRDSGLNDGCEVTERDAMWIYAILWYGSGSHSLLTGVGVEGLPDF